MLVQTGLAGKRAVSGSILATWVSACLKAYFAHDLAARPPPSDSANASLTASSGNSVATCGCNCLASSTLLAAAFATSVCTLSRVCLAETGLTFKAWRQRARIVHAMDSLARGKAIAQVASELGFASTASFSCAFRQVTATTPGAFLEPSA